jgi:outer membrane autotransporter protein
MPFEPSSALPRSHRVAARLRPLLAGVSLLSLFAGAIGAQAGTYNAFDETSLIAAINQANADGDASSTVTLTGSFQLNTPLPSIAGKAITIETGANTLTLASGTPFDVQSGATLTLSGEILGTGVLNSGTLVKTGEGQLVISGATGAGITRIGLDGGHTLISGGSDITFGSSTGAAVSQLDIAGEAGQVASLTISGPGTGLVATGTDPTDLSGGTASQSTLTIEEGASYSTTTGIRVHTPSSGGLATINVLDKGSTLEGGSFSSNGGTSYINVLGGGVVDISGVTSFGGAANNAHAAGNVTAIVSGDGSRWDTDTLFYMHTGSLSILDGGVVTAGTVNIGTTTHLTLATDFDVLVSGAGSELSATAINLGTRRTGTLTIADDGRVVVNGGASALVVGGAFPNSDATLNIGGAAGEAATAAGTLDASAVTLAASANVNFNHTDSAYDFAPVFTGAGTINHLGTGKTVLAQDSSAFAGTTNVYSGTLSVDGMLGGTMNVYGGRLQGTGEVGTTFNHAGGTIAPGNSIGVLTVAGDYTSNGGGLEIESVLGTDGSPADLLHINGNSLLGTGVTPITVINVGGTGGVTTGDGILIVQVDGATSEDLFTLARPAIGGAYRYDLFQHDLAGVGGDWFLRGSGVLAPTVPTLENYPVALLGMIDLPTLRQRVGQGEANEHGIVTRIEGGAGHYEAASSTSGASYDSSMFLAQIGMAGRLIDTDDGSLTAGLTAQYNRHYANVFSAYGNGSNSTESFGLGASLTWRGSEGSYVDLQGQFAHFSTDLSAVGYSLVQDNGGTGFALGIEAGHTFALDDAWSLTPQGQLNYASVGFDRFTDGFGSEVSLQQGDSLKGRIGLALDYATQWQDAEGRKAASTLYGITNLTYEFLDGTGVAVSGTDLNFVGQKFGAELGVGGTLDWADGAHALHGELLGSTSFQGSYAVKGTIGFTSRF